MIEETYHNSYSTTIMNSESDDDDDGQGLIGSDNGSQSSEYSSSDEDDDDEQVGLKGNVQLYYEDNINFPDVKEKNSIPHWASIDAG